MPLPLLPSRHALQVVQVAQGLQTIVTRAKKPIDAAVLSITVLLMAGATTLIGLLPTMVESTPFQRANFVQIVQRYHPLMIRIGEGAGAFASIPRRSCIAEAQAAGDANVLKDNGLPVLTLRLGNPLVDLEKLKQVVSS